MKVGLLQVVGVCMVGAILVSGCIKQKFSTKEEQGTVEFSFNWENLVAGDTKPENIKLHFYGANNTISLFDANASKFSGTLPAQSYKVLAVNTGCSTVEFRGLDSYETASVYAKNYSGSVMALSKADVHMIDQPQGVYGASLGSLVVESDKTTTQDLQPFSYVSTISLALKVDGDELAVTGCCARVSGIACGMVLASREVICNGPKGSVVMHPEIKSDQYKATFSIFGTAPETANNLTLDFEFDNGGMHSVTVDISDALVDINKPTVSDVSVDVDVGVSKNAEGEFTATVKGWVAKTEDIEINRPNQIN